MINEKKKMMEYINQLDNKQMEKTEKTSKKLTVTLSTIVLMIVALIIAFFYVIASFFYYEIYLAFSTEEEQLIIQLEKMYNQNIEIVETNCDEKANGTYVLRTTKEPKIEFHAVKEAYYPSLNLQLVSSYFLLHILKIYNQVFYNSHF